MQIDFTAKEQAVIAGLAEKHDISEAAVIRQALRLLQLWNTRHDNGETVAWSGDGKRESKISCDVGEGG